MGEERTTPNAFEWGKPESMFGRKEKDVGHHLSLVVLRRGVLVYFGGEKRR